MEPVRYTARPGLTYAGMHEGPTDGPAGQTGRGAGAGRQGARGDAGKGRHVDRDLSLIGNASFPGKTVLNKFTYSGEPGEEASVDSASVDNARTGDGCC